MFSGAALALPPDDALAHLLDQYAPFRPAPLVPEISVFYGRSLIEVWEAAERLAGRELPAPFWAYPWAAGIAIARVVLDHPEWVRALRVLDFGCGGGVAALAAARAEAREVVANDIDPWALATARIAAHRQALQLTMLQQDLTDEGPDSAGFDVVLCSDLSYERSVAPRQRELLELAARQGVRVLVADAGRRYFSPDGLREIACFEIDVPRDLEGVDRRTARVFLG
ncbi:MAG: class I SAM-dependent methyltransferase [Longimicrobiales bacterium]